MVTIYNEVQYQNALRIIDIMKNKDRLTHIEEIKLLDYEEAISHYENSSFPIGE